MRPPTGAAAARKGGAASSSAADRRSLRRSSSPPPSRRAAPSPARRSPNPAARPAPPPYAFHIPDPAAAVPPPPPTYAFHIPEPAAAVPPPPPTYGFHNLDRRTAVLADGSARSYFALPPDYSNDPLPRERLLPAPDFVPDRFREPTQFLRDPRGLPEDGFLRRQHAVSNAVPSGSGVVRTWEKPVDPRSVKHAGRVGREEAPAPAPAPAPARSPSPSLSPSPPPSPAPAPASGTVDGEQQALKRAFLKFAKIINADANIRNNYLANGKKGSLKCLVCDRAREFGTVRALASHAYYAQDKARRADHLGLHKAMCVLLGWDYAVPENTKLFELLSDDAIVANTKDLILWPPTVIIHNTSSGQNRDGFTVGLGTKDMNTKLQELGFAWGKPKAVYTKDGHTGVTLVKFANTEPGLKEAERLAEYFEKESHGREAWVQVQASKSGDDIENPALVEVDSKSKEKKRILYGYMATVLDFEKLDPDTRKKAVVKSRKELYV